MARYRCPGCGYLYDEALGDEHEGFPPSTEWGNIPENWSCPDCAVRDKRDFEKLDNGPETSARQGKVS